MNINNYITMDSFGSECPLNWEAIADALNEIIDERGILEDDEACNELWEAFCRGKLENVPEPVTSFYYASDSELIQAIKNLDSWDWNLDEASACQTLCKRAGIHEDDYMDDNGEVDGEAMLAAAAEALGFAFDDLL